MSKLLYLFFILIWPYDLYSTLAGQELYDTRPDILSLESISHNGLGDEWEKLKKAHLEITAMLFESYTDRHYYFLARDSELLYDFARLAARNNPDILSRIHLINVSQDNMNDPHLKDYLKQEGISEELLNSGKKIVFVDTGYNGTIPRVIAEKFSIKARGQLQTHLICSANSKHPSSRVFLSALDPSAAKKNPLSMYWSLYHYEHMPRFTDRSRGFVYSQNRWQAFSPISGQYDGVVSKTLAKKYQEDLRNFVLKNEEFLNKRREIWRQLFEINSEDASKKIKELLKLNPGDHFYESLARDYAEMSETNFPHFKIDFSSLGLEKDIVHHHAYKNSVSEINKLIKEKNWVKLQSIYGSIEDAESNKILAKLLGNSKLSIEGEEFLNFLIIKGDPSMLHYLEIFTFSSPYYQKDRYKKLREAIRISDARERNILLGNRYSLKTTAIKSCRSIQAAIRSAFEQLKQLAN